MWCSDSAQLKRTCGFTLLELMVVVLLLGLLLGVGLNIGVTESSTAPEQQLQRLSQQFTLATLEAVQSGTLWGLDFYRQPDGSGYRWLSHDGMRWQAAEPTNIDADVSDFRWPAGMVSELMIEGRVVAIQPAQILDDSETTAQPDILLLPTRESTPFTLTLQQRTRASMTVDALSRVRLTEAVDALP